MILKGVFFIIKSIFLGEITTHFVNQMSCDGIGGSDIFISVGLCW